MPASWVCTARIFAGAGAFLGMALPGWTDYPAFGIPAGTAVTPNYVDNASARVAPWCDCGASGNRREECEAFRGLFTRNRCLGEGPWQGGGVIQSVPLPGFREAHFRGEESEALCSSHSGPLPPLLSSCPLENLCPTQYRETKSQTKVES